MKIGIDIDNTITNTSILANRLANNIKTCNTYHDLEKNDIKKFLTKYLDDIVYNATLKDNVLDVLNKWQSKGYKIIFITARGTDNVDELVNEKAIYLTSIYFKKMNIPFDEIVFFKNSKADTCKKYELDVFIDDKESVLDEVRDKKINTIRFTDSESKHKTARSWHDVYKIIEEMG